MEGGAFETGEARQAAEAEGLVYSRHLLVLSDDCSPEVDVDDDRVLCGAPAMTKPGDVFELLANETGIGSPDDHAKGVV
ncbi:hypothetical protein ACFQ07_33325 [Actinomadura adrarensis]|uniref:Uncharacterized protein n=1 Tax=Actinomadura adrarensis TaxID=1819600 RepID=A0ABW3CRF5_9ACTN